MIYEKKVYAEIVNNSSNISKTTYDVGNQGSHLGHAQTCGGVVKLVNGMPALFFWKLDLQRQDM